MSCPQIEDEDEDNSDLGRRFSESDIKITAAASASPVSIDSLITSTMLGATGGNDGPTAATAGQSGSEVQSSEGREQGDSGSLSMDGFRSWVGNLGLPVGGNDTRGAAEATHVEGDSQQSE